jgi:hypothetical protein
MKTFNDIRASICDTLYHEMFYDMANKIIFSKKNFQISLNKVNIFIHDIMKSFYDMKYFMISGYQEKWN